ncbi:MAG: hypothetical protein K2H84_07445 [Paramuribaculum sp.]|nr:hypothetical protein [Paramuribaculum sp.]
MDKENNADGATEKNSCRGCCTKSGGTPRGKLHCFNWLADVPGGKAQSDLVEVQFKNTRKGFYKNSIGLDLAIGDLVAVEASPGHDIGEVTLTGQLVALQMKKAGVKPGTELKRVFRKAKPGDLEKYREAQARENDTMIRARKIAEDLKLNMKIGDVEFQGDGNKAIFYYIADERVDFRQLIKVLAETFKVRIEMKQIGARQEAGRIGGIGPCGRPLCCASWMTNFVSVGTAAARFQDISLNPQKLAGQCAKLKCCINFEVDTYVESVKKMPSKEIRLETADSTYYHFKYDVFKREITYSTDKNIAANLVTIDADRAFEVIALNKKGEKPLSLLRDGDDNRQEKKQYNDILGQDITRFDKKKKKKKNKSAQNRQQGDNSRTQENRNEKQGEKNDNPKQNRKDRGNRRDRNLKPGDTPNNTAEGEGRNADRAIAPAMSPSRRMLNQNDKDGE